MVNGSIHKVVAERGGGSTKVDTAAAAAAVAVVTAPAAPTALPPSSPPSFSHSLYHLMHRPLRRLEPLQELYQHWQYQLLPYYTIFKALINQAPSSRLPN